MGYCTATTTKFIKDHFDLTETDEVEELANGALEKDIVISICPPLSSIPNSSGPGRRIRFLAVPPFRYGEGVNLKENINILESLQSYITDSSLPHPRVLYLHDYALETTTVDDDKQCGQLPLTAAVVGKDCHETTLLVLDGGDDVQDQLQRYLRSLQHSLRHSVRYSQWYPWRDPSSRDRITKLLHRWSKNFGKFDCKQRIGEPRHTTAVRMVDDVLRNPKARFRFHDELRRKDIKKTTAYEEIEKQRRMR
ncbi:hypothetical protein M426DRAFT_267815 [Hypoxylon sp. CI-4A]|nr:hypothetical protein M426DRAFT_267815 [Hypoxylon sp. CI-4A]